MNNINKITIALIIAALFLGYYVLKDNTEDTIISVVPQLSIKQEDNNTSTHKITFKKNVQNDAKSNTPTVNNNLIEQKVAHTISSIPENEYSQEMVQDLQSNMQGLWDSAKSHNWKDFFNNTDSLSSEDQGALDFALLQAVMNNAPIEIIETLLNKGALFSPEIINVLALKNNIKLIKQLIPYGLDIYTKDKYDRTAIHYTLMTFNSKETFDYFLANNMDINSSNTVMDALDRALNYAQKSNRAIYYVNKLIENGAKIKESHKQYLKKIKSANHNAFLAITAEHRFLLE